MTSRPDGRLRRVAPDDQAGPRYVTLICAECNRELDGKNWDNLDARLLGDGSVVVSCDLCHRDVGIIHDG